VTVLKDTNTLSNDFRRCGGCRRRYFIDGMMGIFFGILGYRHQRVFHEYETGQLHGYHSVHIKVYRFCIAVERVQTLLMSVVVVVSCRQDYDCKEEE
jgi:hypothetical protein